MKMLAMPLGGEESEFSVECDRAQGSHDRNHYSGPAGQGQRIAQHCQRLH
jgi:hypothetical protein